MNAEEKRLHRLQMLEDHIGQALQQSQQSGELQTAQNWGKPLDLGDGYAQTPLELRMGYKLLKDAGVVPPEVELMRQIDEKHMLHPWLGVPRMVTWLNRDMGYRINKKRIERLYRLMGISATGPKPNTSKKGKGELHRIYKYLLRNLEVTRCGQVWAMDITYIPVRGGYLYLCGIIDLYSRYVLNWALSNTMEAEWCAGVLSDTIKQYGKPETFNTDQGSQFTSDTFPKY